MKKSYLSKQLIAIIVILSVAAVTLVLYFAVLRPYLKSLEEAKNAAAESAPVIEGETLLTGGVRIMTINENTGKQIITLGRGSEYSWNLCVERETGLIYIDGYEQLPLNNSIAPYMYFSLRAPQATRILPSVEELKEIRSKKTASMSKSEIEAYGGADKVPVSGEDLSSYDLPFEEYGLGDLSAANYIRIVDVDGVTHKIYVGEKTPDGKSIYAMYEGRKALYVISATSASYYTMRAEELVSPILMAVPSNASTGNYVPDVFAINREGEPYVRIVRFDSVEAIAFDHATNSIFFKYIYDDENGDPVYNSYDTSSEYAVMLYENLTSAVYADEVLEISPCHEVTDENGTYWAFDELPAEILGKYGIDINEAYLAFRYEKDEIIYLLLFSRPFEEEGVRYYYVYSPVFQMIMKVAASKVSFIEKEDTFFISSYVSVLPLDKIDRITIDSSALKEGYLNEAAGLIRISECYQTKYRMTADGTQRMLDAGGQATLLDVLTTDGRSLPAPEGYDNVTNFRNLYYALVRIRMNPNVAGEMERIEKVDLETPDVVVTSEVYKGATHVLKFYFYGTAGNQCFYTYDDGKERYVVNAGDVAKLLRAVENARAGIYIPTEV